MKLFYLILLILLKINFCASINFFTRMFYVLKFNNNPLAPGLAQTLIEDGIKIVLEGKEFEVPYIILVSNSYLINIVNNKYDIITSIRTKHSILDQNYTLAFVCELINERKKTNLKLLNGKINLKKCTPKNYIKIVMNHHEELQE
ncbi:hypothetical protein Mgra_00004377, partial [Meloidogyne graminicola]